MKNIFKSGILSLLFSLATLSPLFSQEGGSSLEEQFIDIKKRSNNYQIYEVVKTSDLDEYWRNVSDSLKAIRNEVSDLKSDLKTERAQTGTLNTRIQDLEKSLEESQFVSDRITFLGIPMLKSTYNTIVWLLIIVLAILALILHLRFKRSNRITITTRREHEHLLEEFEAHRKRTRESETQLKRDLQTQFNKVIELQQMLDNMK